jgi:PHD/YefM family antitoxin component YafN of YafNO toxin-antitoxin module
MTCLISKEDPEYYHFNIWNCFEEDVVLYYPSGLNVVILNKDEYEVCIQDTTHLAAFNKGYKLIMEKINENIS